MLIEAVAIGGLGLVAALGLGVAARVFRTETNPLAEAVLEALPGANCGGCGFAGCGGAAEAIATGKAPANVCVGGGSTVQAAVAAILGVEVTAREPELAQVGCRYPVTRADLKYAYDGLTDCRGAVLLAGGPKECPVGCIGLGSCAKACPFDALAIGPDRLPVVDPYKCTGCGTCVRTCPVGIMRLTSVSDRILNELTLDQCSAPCQRACPAGIDIPEQIRQTALGNHEQALLVIKERNPLPLVCGRICPHPCEEACRRNLADQPVAINPLKRFVSDLERNRGQRLKPYKAPATHRKVAIIGGGAEGLSAAWFLARLGHDPVILEAEGQLGGLLRKAIAPARLPREVLDWEIEGILELGAEARTSQALGRDFTLASLFAEGFSAAFLATGGFDSRLLAGSEAGAAPALPRVHLLLPLAQSLAAGEPPAPGRTVAILGRQVGRPLLSLARALKQKGAAEVAAVILGGREACPLPPEELARAEAEGVRLLFGARVLSLAGRGDELTGLVYEREGDRGELGLDTLVLAGGRLPELLILPEAGEDGAWRTVAPYRPPHEVAEGLGQQMEPISDFAATVEAIGAGRRAAASLHLALTGKEVAPPPRMLDRATPVLDVQRVENLLKAPPRQAMPTLDPVQRERLPRAEVELGLSPEQAKSEARRCLNCGLICYYRSRYN